MFCFVVVFCPPVPSAWSESWFNSTINEFQSTIMYHCNENYTFTQAVREDTAYTFLDIWPMNIMVSTVAPGDTSGMMVATTAYCGENKQWDPPIAKCVCKYLFHDIKCSIVCLLYPPVSWPEGHCIFFYRPAARDFWFGFDGICALIIVMGIFVLLRV